MRLDRTIRRLRLYHGFRQREVCERTGISRSLMSEIEKGHKQPTLGVIGRIAGVYGLAPSELVYLAEAADRPSGQPLPPLPHPKIELMLTMRQAQMSVRTR